MISPIDRSCFKTKHVQTFTKNNRREISVIFCSNRVLIDGQPFFRSFFSYIFSSVAVVINYRSLSFSLIIFPERKLDRSSSLCYCFPNTNAYGSWWSQPSLPLFSLMHSTASGNNPTKQHQVSSQHTIKQAMASDSAPSGTQKSILSCL